MATLTIRNLDDAVHTALRKRAAEQGRSMEAEARQILADQVAPNHPRPYDVALAIHEAFAKAGSADDLIIPDRHSQMKPLSFDE